MVTIIESKRPRRIKTGDFISMDAVDTSELSFVGIYSMYINMVIDITNGKGMIVPEKMLVGDIVNGFKIEQVLNVEITIKL